MGRVTKRIISIICIGWMVFLPFGSVYATVDCLFHDDAEHISHGIEIATDYEHSHDTISLDLNELEQLSSSGQDMGDTSVEVFLDNNCSSGLLISLSCDANLLSMADWKDPFSDASKAYSLVSTLTPQEIRPPISA